MAHSYNSNTWEAEAVGSASLVYRVSSRTARATQRNPVSKKLGKKKAKKLIWVKLKGPHKAPLLI